MSNLIVCTGRLIIEEDTIFDIFTKYRKVKELLIEFSDGPRCYSKNIGYERKYQILKVRGDYTEYTLLNTFHISQRRPKFDGKHYGIYPIKNDTHNKFAKIGVKLTSSEFNCEFEKSDGKICLQICMSSSRNIFFVTYDTTVFSPEDVTDICGQIITYA